MRVLLISDIHANLSAFHAVLNAAPAYDAIWCLGDVVGYGPKPNECVSRLRELNAVTLTGNHDQAAIGNVALEHFRENARAALAWTRTVLTPENRAWLAARQATQLLYEFGITLVHASPRDPLWEYIENVRIARENFSRFDTPLCFYGHTHQPTAFHFRQEDRVIAPNSLRANLEYAVAPKLLLNPGSVGQPRDGDPRAAFAIYDTDAHSIMPARVAYDIQQTQREILQANLPAQLVARLAAGE